MKKIFTLMLAFACAMFVGVSCTPDTGEGGGEDQYAVTINVATPEVFAAEGGEAELTYTLSKEIAGEAVVLDTEATASWLSVGQPEDGSYKVLLSCTANQMANGQQRTTTFTLSYKDAKDVVVTVAQEPATEQFEVIFSNQTPFSADASVHPKDLSMTWGATLVHGGELSDGQSPAEYLLANMATMVEEIGGYYKLFLFMSAGGQYTSATGCSKSLFACQQTWDKSKMYLCIVGLKDVDSSLAEMLKNDPYAVYSEEFSLATDNSKLATAVQVVEVETLPEPSFTLDAEKTVAYTAGEFTLDAPLANVWGEGTVDVQTDVTWVTPTWENGKLTVAYTESPYAIDRKAIVQLQYVVKVQVALPWDPSQTYEEEKYFGTTQLVLTQEKNPNVTPVTLTIEVLESHFDHILVNVTPSDLEAEYVLNAIEKTDFNNYRDGDWAQVQEIDLRNPSRYVHTGKLENYKLAISTGYASSWDWYAYAYAVDSTNKVATGELTYQEVAVLNDAPHFTCPEGWVDNEGQFELTVSEPGTYTVKLNLAYAPEDATIWSNTWPNSDTEFTLTYYNYIFDKVTIDNTNKTVTFTVAEPTDWTYGFDPYSSFGLKLCDPTNKTTYSTPKTFKVIYKK